MADETDTKPAQKLVKLPQAVHQLVTGKNEKDVIEPGTLITDEIAKANKLTDEVIKQLTKTGAITLADVLTV